MEILTKNTRKVYIQYTIPSVFGMLAVSSASVVDGYFVGNYVGASGLAAINLTMPIFAILFGLSLMLGVGSSVVSGKMLGAGDKTMASIIFSKTCLAVGCFSLLLILLIYAFLEPALESFGASGKLLRDSTLYIYVFLPFIPFLMIGIIFDYFVKTDGRPNLAFFALLLSAVVNVLLDWLLVAYLNQGLLGAALATGIAQVSLIIVLLPHFFSHHASIKFKKTTGQWLDVIKAGSNGASEFVNEASVGITALIFNYVMLQTHGVQGVAAYAVISYLIWFSIMINFGISDALQPMISKNLGAKKIDRISKFVKYALASVSICGVIIVSLLYYYPNDLIELFLPANEFETINIVKTFITFIWPLFLFNGISLVISAYFTATHKPLPSACIALARSLLLPVILVYLLPMYMGEHGIYLAVPIAEFLAMLLAILLLKQMFSNKNSQSNY